MIIIALGTNLGDKKNNLQCAITALSKIGTVVSQSQIYHSEAWGFESENDFYNMVLTLDTPLTATELLTATQQIERELGRTKKSNNAEYSDRVIDIDIIDYHGTVSSDENLQLPHPLMHQRLFVLEPLWQIAPDWQHPLLHSSAAELLQNLKL